MIRIITDSAADFSRRSCRRLFVVPTTISFGEDSYTDGVDPPQEIFWQHMEAGQNRTSQPSPVSASLKPRRTRATAWCILVFSALGRCRAR
ncbi:MAG: DegV family protein [Christensenellales bacterium]